jgi:F0F1-type ATP synthase assembly protein I
MSAAIATVLPAAGGYWLDQKLQTEPWVLIAGALLGMGLGAVQLMRLIGGSGSGKSGAGTPPERK